jgi:PAS domain-containing protein
MRSCAAAARILGSYASHASRARIMPECKMPPAGRVLRLRCCTKRAQACHSSPPGMLAQLEQLGEVYAASQQAVRSLQAEVRQLHSVAAARREQLQKSECALASTFRRAHAARAVVEALREREQGLLSHQKHEEEEAGGVTAKRCEEQRCRAEEITAELTECQDSLPELQLQEELTEAQERYRQKMDNVRQELASCRDDTTRLQSVLEEERSKHKRSTAAYATAISRPRHSILYIIIYNI